jgi:hypothetical protein
MDTCILFALPEALSRQLLVKWLDFSSVVRMDSAMCASKVRRKYFKLVYGRHTTFTVESYQQRRKFNSLLRWTASRNAQLDGIRLTGELYGCDDLLETFSAVSGPAVQWIDSCELELNDCSATRQEVLLTVAEACPNVKTLNIQDSKNATELWDETLVTLTTGFPQLTNLALYDVQFSEQGLATALKHCHHLEKLRVRSKHAVLPAEIALPSLKSLATGSGNVTDAVLVAVGKRCTKLERLAIFSSMSNANTSSVTDVGVSAVLQGCPLLCNVDVQYAGGISTELRVELARRCNFTTLTLCHWDNMSEELARGLLTVSPNLTALDCGDCFWLSDDTLAVCAQHCPLLKSISIKRCHEVTTAGAIALVSKVGHNLSTVNLGDCSQLGDEIVLAIAEHCPRLTEILCPPSVSAAAVAALERSCPLLLFKG